MNKRAVADCIQEGLEAIRDIKACSRQEAYMGKLEEKLADMEKGSIHSELATGVFVCSAQAFLRLGLATTIPVSYTHLDSSIILASQNIEDFLIPSIREFTKPLFSIPILVREASPEVNP